jgi:hypothetical protein
MNDSASAASRKDHEPMLLWVVNNWAVAGPLLHAATERLNPKVEVLLLDVRTPRGTPVSSLDPPAVVAAAKIVELPALRSTLSSHPYLYEDKWAKEFSRQMKDHVKKTAGRMGACFLFAIGDATRHAPNEAEPLPDFTMKIAPYYDADLAVIREHAAKQLAQQQQQQQRALREQAQLLEERARKRAEIAKRVEAARWAAAAQASGDGDGHGG